MAALRRLLAVLLGLTALALALHFIAGVFYDGYLERPHLLWDTLNILSAAGLVVVLVCQFRRKRAFDRRHQDDSVSFEYLAINGVVLMAVFLSLWFFANWFEELNTLNESGGMPVSFVWIAFNAAFPVLAGATAFQMWRARVDPVSDSNRMVSSGTESTTSPTEESWSGREQ